MIRKMTMLVLLVVFASTASFAMAEDVYVTKNGKKYHKEDCRLIKNKKPIKVDMAQAIDKKLEPCHLCFKDKLSQVENKTKPKK